MDTLRLPIPAGLQTAADSPFVGRTHELRQLSQLWDLVVSGRRQFVFVGGEPGAGKTRLMAELAAACHDDGAVVLLGSNTRDLGYALQPFVEILGQLAMQPSVFDDLAESTVDQLARVSSRVDTRGGSTEFGQWRDDPGGIFNAITELLRTVAVQQPVVLALDNLHWSGSQTRRMLTYLATRTAHEHLLVVATHRTTAPDRSDDLTLAIAEMHGLPGVTRVDLPGLDATDIARYLVVTSGLSDSEARRSATVLRDQTGGNPFILEEARRDLQRHGSLPVTARQVLRAPRSVRDMLELRIREMAPTSAAILERAAIVGDVIDLPLLVTKMVAVEQALSALDDGVEFGLLAEADDGTYAFRHSLTRQAFVARMPLARRLEVHAEIGLALEERPQRTPEMLSSLAHHFTKAATIGYALQAADYLEQAAAAARAGLAHDEAAAAYEQAAAMRGGSIELEFEAARSLNDAARFDEARRRYMKLTETEDPEQFARAAVGFEDAGWVPNADIEISLNLLSKAMDALEDGSELHTTVMASLGRSLLMTGAADEALRIGRHALRRARESGNDDLIAHALMAMVNHMWGPEGLNESLALCEELAALGRKQGILMQLALGLGVAENTTYRLGRGHDYRVGREKTLQVVEISGHPFVGLSAASLVFSAHYLEGRFDEARVVAEQMLEEGMAFEEGQARGVYGMQMFMIKRATGELARLPTELVQVAADAGNWKPGKLAIYVEHQMVDEVRSLLPAVIAECEDMSTLSAQWAALAVFAVEAVALVGDRSGAERMRALLEPFDGTNLMAGHLLLVYGSANRYLGFLDHVLGRDSATGHFEKALEMEREMESPIHEAETLLSFAAHLDSVGEKRRAAELRQEGRAITERIGLRRAIPLEQRPRIVVDLNDHDLSPREVDVLRLLALGMSNREIGDELMISANTAANHVRSILMKTGSANRTQAAVYAAGRGLV